MSSERNPETAIKPTAPTQAALNDVEQPVAGRPDVLGKRLRQLYVAVVEETVPADLQVLLNQLDSTSSEKK